MHQNPQRTDSQLDRAAVSSVTRCSPKSHDVPPSHMMFLRSLVSSSHNQTKTKVPFKLCHPNHACMNISWLHKKVSVASWPGPARPGNPRGHLTLSVRSSLRVKQFQRASLLEYEAPNLQAEQAGTGRSNQSAESHSSLSDDNDKQSNTSSQKRSSSQSSALSRGLAEAHCYHNLFSPL